MRKAPCLLPIVSAFLVSAMLPLGEQPPVAVTPPKPPGLDAVLAFYAPRVEGPGAAAAWVEIEKIPGIVWVGAGPHAAEAAFERDGVGVLRGVGAVEMTARGPHSGVAEIDVTVTSPYAEPPGNSPPVDGFAPDTAVERLAACSDAFHATLPGRRTVYLAVRKVAAGILIAFRSEPPACS
jgi:hypothetical protein